MKKTVCLFLFLYTAISLQAQSELGIKAGYYQGYRFTNVGSLNGRTLEFEAPGNYIGIFSNVDIADKFQFQSELTYINLRARSLDRVQASTFLNYKIGRKFYVFAGPQLDFFLFPESPFKKVNLSIALGIGYHISNKLMVEFKGDYGLTKLATDTFGDHTQVHGWQIGLKYRF